MASISKRSVDATKAGQKDSYLWDNDLKGFGLKVTPAGRKVYLIQYRLGGRKGRTRRVTIGVHGVLTADEARARAKQLLGDVAAGRDPAATLQEERGSRRLGGTPDALPSGTCRGQAQAKHRGRVSQVGAALHPSCPSASVSARHYPQRCGAHAFFLGRQAVPGKSGGGNVIEVLQLV